MKLMMTWSLSAVAAAFAATTAYTRPAAACGGTFCDSGPNAMPVDQTGENILFVMGGSFTEAHIQIQYDPNTEADEFAWVIPLTAVPEFSIGSDPLFANLLSATVPNYGFTTTFTCEGDAANASAGSPAGGDGGAEGTGGDDGSGPEVVLQETVGAFDITVLQGGTAQEVMTWLGDNGYQQDPAAEPIIEEYLAENYLFAAFKLTTNAGVSEIHPVTLRFPNDEACVPLRLTRIAAQEDMDVRTFFLAEDRVVPQNYKHVLVNPLKLDWPSFASNYKEVITMAVDAEEANGKAFVTEYAGPSNVVSTGNIHSSSWSSAALAELTPEQAVTELTAQGLLVCYEDWWSGSGGETDGTSSQTFCDYTHPLLRGLLQRYIPAPEGVDETYFYGCPSCYADQFDADAWDAAAFAADLEERIIAPGKHAVDILDAWPTLTRMYTTISPAEMTADPFFYQNPDLPDVDLRSQVANQQLDCNGDAVWVLPDGREVFVPSGSPWPDFSDEMPWEEDVEETPSAGAPLPLVDNTDKIQSLLTAHNCEHGHPSNEACGEDGESAGLADAGTGGCGCRATPGSTPWAWALLVLGGGGLLHRRRRT